MEKIYTYQWRGIRTGWDYKVVFKKASSLALGDHQIVKLPRGSFSIKKTSWEYDTYPLGLTSAKILEAEINLDLLSGVNYDEFAQMLYNPVLEISRNFNLVEHSYYSGTLVELFIKFNKNSETAVNDERLIFAGLIREEEEIEQGESASIYKFTAEDVNRAIHEQLPFKALNTINDADDVTRAGYIEVYDEITGKSIVQIAGNEKTVLFQTFTAFEEFINEIALQMYRDFRRDTTLNYELSLPMPRLYKQTYDGSGNRGVVLNKQNIYLLSQVYYQVSPLSGAFNSEDEDGIAKNYQCSWDFIADWLESSMRKGWFDPYGFRSSAICGFYATERIVEIDAKKAAITIRQHSKILKKVSTSLYETKDGEISDIDSFEELANSNRNGNEYSVPVYFNSMPSQANFTPASSYIAFNSDENTGQWLEDLSIAAIGYVGSSLRKSGLYYKDNAGFMENANGEMVRVHEYVNYLIQTGQYSEEIVPFIPVLINTHNKPEVLTIELQNNSSAAVLPKVILGIYGNYGQYTAKIVLPIDYKVEFKAGGSVGYWIDEPDTVLQLSLQDIDPRRGVTENQWHIRSSTIDYEKEIVEMEIILRMI